MKDGDPQKEKNDTDGGPAIDATEIRQNAIPILVPTLSSRSVMLAIVVGNKHFGF